MMVDNNNLGYYPSPMLYSQGVGPNMMVPMSMQGQMQGQMLSIQGQMGMQQGQMGMQQMQNGMWVPHGSMGPHSGGSWNIDANWTPGMQAPYPQSAGHYSGYDSYHSHQYDGQPDYVSPTYSASEYEYDNYEWYEEVVDDEVGPYEEHQWQQEEQQELEQEPQHHEQQ